MLLDQICTANGAERFKVINKELYKIIELL